VLVAGQRRLTLVDRLQVVFNGARWEHGERYYPSLSSDVSLFHVTDR
jgi:hypothetical protein